MHYEGGGFTTPATDIICPMYARVSQIESFAAMAPESERRPVSMLSMFQLDAFTSWNFMLTDPCHNNDTS